MLGNTQLVDGVLESDGPGSGINLSHHSLSLPYLGEVLGPRQQCSMCLLMFSWVVSSFRSFIHSECMQA